MARRRLLGEVKKLSADNEVAQQTNFVYVEAYLYRSPFSDGHAVNLYIERPDGEEERKIISVHSDIVRALEICQWYNQELSSSKFFSNHSNDEITTKVINKVVSRYGEYDSDDAEFYFQPSVSRNVLKPVVPPIQKQIIVEAFSSPDFIKMFYRHGIDRSYYEDLSDLIADNGGVIFMPVYRHSEDSSLYFLPFLTSQGSVKYLLSNTYFQAAYVADYMNERGLGQISTELADELRLIAFNKEQEKSPSY